MTILVAFEALKDCDVTFCTDSVLSDGEFLEG